MQEKNVIVKLQQFALDHPTEWEVVTGARAAGADELLRIQKTLKEAGFVELPEMLAMRIMSTFAGESIN